MTKYGKYLLVLIGVFLLSSTVVWSQRTVESFWLHGRIKGNLAGRVITIQLVPLDPAAYETETSVNKYGWYAFSVFLSKDGAHLVRLGNWPRGHAPSDSHLAVAFYKYGLLMKSYSTKDLILDVTKVTPTVSHYFFLQGRPGFSDSSSTVFTLTTVDGVEYHFDVSNGNIVSMESNNGYE